MDHNSAPVRGLVAGCHPGPTLVVTSVLTVLAASLGRGAIGCLWLLLAVLTGQLATGWSNDARDVERDTRAGRAEKPVVRGWIAERWLWVAAVAALTMCVPLSIVAAGPIGGCAHLVAVGSALTYNLWLKTTAWSFVPYLLSFGLVVPFLTYGQTPAHPPAAWAVAALALVGLGAHLANGITDIEGDRVSGSEGFVGRLGGRPSAQLSILVLLVASALLLVYVGLRPIASIAVMTGLALGSIVAATALGGRHLFPAVMLLAVVDTSVLSLHAGIIIGT